MVWQDVIIAICIIAFSYALIPQIILGFKEKKKLIAFQTAIITSIGMFILSITYITLGLPFSTVMGLITAILWAILLVQSVIYKS